MKYISCLIIFSVFLFNDGFYDLSFKDIDNNTIKLSEYKGKKILFIVLSTNANDSNASVKDLSALAVQYSDKLIIIGIPAEEEGYKSAMKKQMKNIYPDRPSNFIIAEGMKVKKEAREKQSTIFQWLTSKDKNKHFEQDERGPGHKFFVDERGDLYAVMGSQVKLSHPVISRIISRPLPTVTK